MADTTHNTMSGHTEQPHGPGLPQLNAESFSSQLFWLTVTFVALYLLVARSILPRIHDVLEKRQHHLNQDLDRADMLSREAEDARTAYEKLQADARGKAQQLITETQASITRMQEKKFAEVDADLSDRLGKAREDIASRKATLRDKLVPVTKEVTAQLVDKLIGVKPTQEQLDTGAVSGQNETTKKRQAG